VAPRTEDAAPDRPAEAPPGAGGTDHEAVAHEGGPLLWTCLVVGWAVIVFGLHGLLSNKGTNPPDTFRLLIGLNIVNDALVVPLILAVAVVVRRIVPRWLLVPVDVGLITSAVVVLYAYPLVGSWGKGVRAGSSRLPFDYAHSLAMVLGAIWVVCALMALWSWRRSRSTSA